ncbi:hypothetical protein, partial [Paenilisteria weihenstephanensis]|uniref:hypothetical protein n=1 Tax=Listeria weihenstephanensis TaxID=1006155 RepID=UPI001F3335D0
MGMQIVVDLVRLGRNNEKKAGLGHNPDKSAKSARIQGIWRTSGSHIHQYAPLPASTKSPEYKRFRSICLKQNFFVLPE